MDNVIFAKALVKSADLMFEIRYREDSNEEYNYDVIYAKNF